MDDGDLDVRDLIDWLNQDQNEVYAVFAIIATFLFVVVSFILCVLAAVELGWWAHWLLWPAIPGSIALHGYITRDDNK